MSDDRTSDELAFLRKEVRRLREALNDLTPGIDAILRRRGFRIYKKEPSEDLLIPAGKYVDEYYCMLHKYSFRLLLRDVIKHQDFFSSGDVTRYSTANVTEEYLEYLARVGLVKRKAGGYRLVRHIKSFGVTLEWYVAEIFRREFGAEAVWGVKFKRPKVGGDYDVITKFDGSLLYAEVKSSPPKQIHDNEIAAFLDRAADLSPAIAVFLMDTELRMKDKIVPMFEDELRRRSSGENIVRIERELFRMGDRLFIINSKHSIASNIGVVFQWYFRRHGA
jgi:hypothetical protein